MMMQPHINEKKGVPWWAAIGAPLIGVPIMVALLTLASPSENPPEVGSRSELVEPQVVRPAVLEAEYFEEQGRS
ncbi:MAG TPA: hypothetical protein EYQ27_12815 [Gemmatimonadetes bacterium]|nr:hypothetical protein [Gemmatimonadota bacterium]